MRAQRACRFMWADVRSVALKDQEDVKGLQTCLEREGLSTGKTNGDYPVQREPQVQSLHSVCEPRCEYSR